MTHRLSIASIFIFTVAMTLAGCKATVLPSIPAAGTIKHNAVVYAENDGRCPDGQVIKITGGNNTQNIPRVYDCVDRP